MTAALGDLLLAKALLCAISVVKADRVQGEANTAMYKGRYSTCISLATNGPVWYVNRYVTFRFECTFGKMILPHKKSSVLARFCKLNHHWSLFQRKLCILG